MADEDVEKVWIDFWLGAIDEGCKACGGHFRTDWTVGQPDMTVSVAGFDQIKRELYDFHSVMQVVPAVYDHATGGAMSKITYNDVRQITGAIDEHYAEIERDNVLEALVGLRDTVLEDFEPSSDRAGSDCDEVLSRVIEHIREEFGIGKQDYEDAQYRWDSPKGLAPE